MVCLLFLTTLDVLQLQNIQNHAVKITKFFKFLNQILINHLDFVKKTEQKIKENGLSFILPLRLGKTNKVK